MRLIDSLDKRKKYYLHNLTLSQKSQIFEEAFRSTSFHLTEYLVGRHKDALLTLYCHASGRWRIAARLWENSEDLSKYFKEYQFKYNSKIVNVL